ncbi:MAG TPA: acylneuraminate cytidylyltransferase family protein [Bryobacterales bacterium]|jgi:CMP-N,N'-diacetyllegionaminic acid synthase|nr:acylneuraminate cytidylyltransferase family protein [Bryobacterales bacterium]
MSGLDFRVLGVIPARGGSKGIPRKNIRLLHGRPLLSYTAEAALSARLLSRVILSTDDEEVAEVGRRCGLEVPFLRPPELATDGAPTLPVVQHAVRALAQNGGRFDAVCLLQPTNPLRRPEHIDGCIELLVNSGADSVITVLPVPPEYNPHWVYFAESDGTLRLSTGEDAPISRRQDLPPAFHREGSVYVIRTEVIIDGNSLYGRRIVGYPADPKASVNIDVPEDWERAEELLAAGVR